MLLAEFKSSGWKDEFSVLIFAGEDPESLESFSACIERVQEKQPEVVVESFQTPEHELGAVLEKATLAGLWGEKRLVSYNSDTAPAQKEWASASTAFLAIGDNILILRFQQYRAHLGENLPPGQLLIDCRKVKVWAKDLKHWLMGEARALEVNLTADGASEMVDRLGEQALVLKSALSTLQSATPEKGVWNAAAVADYFSKGVAADVFRFAEALSTRDLAVSFEAVEQFLLWDMSPEELIGGLRFHFRRLLMLKIHSDWNLEQAKKSTKVYSQSQLAGLRRQAEKFRLGQLKKIYAELYNLDRESKMFYGRSRDLLETFVLKLYTLSAP